MADHTTGVVLARPDVSVLRTGKGAWVGVGAASFTVRGGAAYDLLVGLLSRSDGSRTGGDLLEEFPEAARPVAERLLGALVAHGCLVVLGAPMSRELAERGPASESLIPRFAQLTDDPVRALDHLRATTLVLCGRPAWLGSLRAVFDAAPLHDLRIAYQAEPGERPVAGGHGTELVVLDADGMPHEDLMRHQDELLRSRVPHGVAGTAGGRYWILWSDDRTTGCWDCLRRYARGEAGAAAVPLPDRLAAAVLAHSVQLRGAGLGDNAGAALSLDPETLAVKPHPVWAVAGCRCHRAALPPTPGETHHDPAGPLVRRDLAGPHDDRRLQDDNDRIVAALARWTDEQIGPFLALDGGDAPQIPFGRAVATVLADAGGAARVREVPAATLSSREALYQAALNAIEFMAAAPGEAGARNLGAGWTVDEALYRALLRQTMRRPASEGALAALRLDDLGDDDCARVARYLERAVLRGTGLDAVRWAGTRLPNGLHRVTGRAGDAVLTEGLGACRAEAVSAALLRMVNDDGVLVPVNPHFRTWPEVWRQVSRPDGAEWTPPAVGFTRDRVRLVEVA